MGSEYCYKSSVGMSGYVPLASRVKGACRCSVCSANSDIAKFYVNDVLCRYDGQPCISVDDLGVRVCSVKRRGRVVRCSRFVGRGL